MPSLLKNFSVILKDPKEKSESERDEERENEREKEREADEEKLLELEKLEPESIKNIIKRALDNIQKEFSIDYKNVFNEITGLIKNPSKIIHTYNENLEELFWNISDGEDIFFTQRQQLTPNSIFDYSDIFDGCRACCGQFYGHYLKTLGLSGLVRLLDYDIKQGISVERLNRILILIFSRFEDFYDMEMCIAEYFEVPKRKEFSKYVKMFQAIGYEYEKELTLYNKFLKTKNVI
jgi:hypothetical protein